jgi:palmitoyltransferase
LLKDLERLHCIVLIARNLLIIGERAQSLCALARCDQEMFDLINVCVKAAARGYDGEPGNPDQKKFDSVVDACK